MKSNFITESQSLEQILMISIILATPPAQVIVSLPLCYKIKKTHLNIGKQSLDERVVGVDFKDLLLLKHMATQNNTPKQVCSLPIVLSGSKCSHQKKAQHYRAKGKYTPLQAISVMRKSASAHYLSQDMTSCSSISNLSNCKQLHETRKQRSIWYPHMSTEFAPIVATPKLANLISASSPDTHLA